MHFPSLFFKNPVMERSQISSDVALAHNYFNDRSLGFYAAEF